VSCKEKFLSKPDFSSYSIEELLDCKQNIDKDRYPERYREILDLIALLTQDPKIKSSHDEIVFIEFCEALRDDLRITLDDNLWPILKLFSKRLRDSVPSTFQDQVCPVCSGDLHITQRFGAWEVECQTCDMVYSITERHSSI
ncbi:hypothetical protein, partial [Alteromonas sp. KUL106]|uniref:hypothetical protein n=1 Tax=Alteromonas sp. KUL106 TaxID=2480799 RepID=UPI001F173FF2